MGQKDLFDAIQKHIFHHDDVKSFKCLSRQ